MRIRFGQWLHRYYGFTFVLMGLAAFSFGAISLNLAFLLRANIELILENGIMVLREGALRQLLELLGFGYASLVFYVLFKTCEHVLVARLAGSRVHPDNDEDLPRS